MTPQPARNMVVSTARMRMRGVVPVAGALSFVGWQPGPVTLTPLGPTVIVAHPPVPGTTSTVDSSAFLRLSGLAYRAVNASPGDSLLVAAVAQDEDVPAHLVIASLHTAAARLLGVATTPLAAEGTGPAYGPLIRPIGGNADVEVPGD